MFYFKILEEEERRTRRKKGEQDKKEIIRTGGMHDRRDARQEQCCGSGSSQIRTFCQFRIHPPPPPPHESNDNIWDPSPIYQSLLILTRSNGVPCNSLEFFKIKYKNSVKETQKLGMKLDNTNFTTTNLNKLKKSEENLLFKNSQFYILMIRTSNLDPDPNKIHSDPQQWTGKMQDMWDEGQVGCRTGGMQDRWDEGQMG